MSSKGSLLYCSVAIFSWLLSGYHTSLVIRELCSFLNLDIELCDFWGIIWTSLDLFPQLKERKVGLVVWKCLCFYKSFSSKVIPVREKFEPGDMGASISSQISVFWYTYNITVVP